MDDKVSRIRFSGIISHLVDGHRSCTSNSAIPEIPADAEKWTASPTFAWMLCTLSIESSHPPPNGTGTYPPQPMA